MSQLTSNLSAIASIKSDIKAAIESKGVSMSGVSFGSYASKIAEIQTGSTMSLTASVNNTYYPASGYVGFDTVIVDVPQSVTGIDEKGYTEHNFHFVNLNNSASYVYQEKFYDESELRTVNLGNCAVVRNSAFYECTNLSEVSLPVCSVISSNAFVHTGIVSLYLPSCQSLGSQAFRYCLSLSQVNMPELISVDMSAFYQCMSLTSISFSKLGYIGSYMFYSCYSLKDLNIPNVSRINNYGFAICRSLESVNLPRVEYVSDYAFWACSNLSSISFPNCVLIGDYAFWDASGITQIDFPYCTYIGSAAFNRCSLVTSISLPMCTHIASTALYTQYRSLSEIDLPMCTYLGSNNFTYSTITKVNIPIVSSCWGQGWWSSPISEFSFGNMTYKVPPYTDNLDTILSNNGKIYVHTTMYSKWLSAVGWSSLSAAFVAFGSDANMPMISVIYDSDLGTATAYGQTWALWNDWYWNYLSVAPSTITGLEFPHCKYVQHISGFSHANHLTFDECKYFEGCDGLYDLVYAELPQCEIIQTSRLFHDCGGEPINIKLGTDLSKVCKLTPTFGGGQPYDIWIGSNANFYVPDNLVNAYKSAWYWSSISSQIFPISEFPEDEPEPEPEEPVEE